MTSSFMSSDIKDLDKITMDLELPSFSSYSLANKIAGEIMQLSRIKESDNLVDAIFKPSIYNKNDYNPYLFRSASMLATAVTRTQEEYVKQGLNVKVSNEDFLKSLTPKKIEMLLFEGDKRMLDVDDFLFGSVEQLLQGIETEMQDIVVTYKPLIKSKEMENFLEQKIEKIGLYANHVKKLAEVFEGYNDHAIAGLMEKTASLLLDKQTFKRDIKRESPYHQLYNVLKLHAELVGVKFNSGIWSFAYNTGEEINLIFHTALKYERARAVVSEVMKSKEERILVPCHGVRYRVESAGSIRELANISEEAAIVEWMFLDSEYILKSIMTDDIFDGIGRKLYRLGVPATEAQNIEDFIMLNKTERLKEEYIELGKSYKEIKHKDFTYPGALKALVESVTGGRDNKITYRFIDDKSIFSPSMIYTIVEVIELRDGKIERIDEKIEKLDVQSALQKNTLLFPKADIYVGENIGACRMLKADRLGAWVNADYSHIEVRDGFSSIKNLLGRDFKRTQTDLHEVTHSRQVGSKIERRAAALYFTTSICESALTLCSDGMLDNRVPFSDIMDLKVKGKTWRQALENLIDIYVVPLLAEGIVGEKFMYDGMINTLYQQGMDITTNHRYDYGLIRKIPLGNSGTASYVKNVRNALRHGKEDHINTLYEEGKEREEEILSVLETMTETFSLEALKKYAKFYPDKRYKKNNVMRMYHSVENSLKNTGRMSKIFMDIMISDVDNKDVLLEKNGMRYVKHLSSKEYKEVESNLVKLGADPIDPLGFYGNMENVFSLAKNAGMKREDFLIPMNLSKANVGIRYRTGINMMQNVISHYNNKLAFDLIMDRESMDEVRNLIL